MKKIIGKIEKSIGYYCEIEINSSLWRYKNEYEHIHTDAIQISVSNQGLSLKGKRRLNDYVTFLNGKKARNKLSRILSGARLVCSPNNISTSIRD